MKSFPGMAVCCQGLDVCRSVEHSKAKWFVKDFGGKVATKEAGWASLTHLQTAFLYKP